MKDAMKIAAGGAAGALCAAALFLGLHALADGALQGDQVPRLLAWHGSLEKDGDAVDGLVQMTFTLFDCEEDPVSPGGSCQGGAGTEVWTESQTVPVDAGRFSVLLGATSAPSVDSLAEAVRAADDLFLEVSILDGEDWVPLSNRKRFVPVPYSHWTRGATDLWIRSLTGVHESGTLLLSGGTLGTTVTGGDVLVHGDELRFNSNPLAGGGGVALQHKSDDRLAINPGAAFTGGTLIQGPLSTLQELVRFKVFDNIGQNQIFDTGFDKDEWLCVIGGVRFPDGDIDEDGEISGTLIDCHAWKLAQVETWWVSVDFHSHQNHEEHEVGVVCFRVGVSYHDNLPGM